MGPLWGNTRSGNPRQPKVSAWIGSPFRRRSAWRWSTGPAAQSCPPALSGVDSHPALPPAWVWQMAGACL
jgi:hypothetical protein